MTRASLKRSLRGVYVVVGLVLAVSLAAKVLQEARLYPDLPIGAVYDYLKDMSLLIVTVAAAYLTYIFQKRASFVDSLREEWRDIIGAKSALIAYCESEQPTKEAYLQAFLKLSETIDNMRIVYRNVGETDRLVGLYPFAPLHDMRRSLQSIEPAAGETRLAQRRLVKDAILQSFYAIREAFLEELDLEEPSSPILPFAARRLKKSGATESADRVQKRQRTTLDAAPGARGDVDALLARLRREEIEAEAMRRERRS